MHGTHKPLTDHFAQVSHRRPGELTLGQVDGEVSLGQAGKQLTNKVEMFLPTVTIHDNVVQVDGNVGTLPACFANQSS